VLLSEVARTSADVAGVPGRLRKVELIAATLTAAGTDAPLVARYLSGELRQRRTGLGYAGLRDLPAPAAEATLTVADVDAAFDAISGCAGAGSQAERRRLVTELFARATADEQRLLVGLVGGELRQGAMESVVTDALARATALPLADVRQAVMLCGSLAEVADAAFRSGAAGLAEFRLVVGRAVQPMLASTAADVAEAIAKVGDGAVDRKIDGVRIQVHRSGDDVRIFTRTLDDITDRLPEIVTAVRALPATTLVLDGEAIALHDDGRPRAFQHTAGRVARKGASEVVLTPLFFDLLHVDGDDLLGRPASERWARMSELLPAAMQVPRLVTNDAGAAQAFFDETIAAGHEGVVVKAAGSAYEAGRRGAGWLKVKPVHTLDLVVLAVEWGHGRRKGWLSNLHLGARDPQTGGFVMLGKTFKGLTDELLRWQTERFLALETHRNDWQVFVRPEQVVEIAFDGVQTSPRYPGGVALRFARVLRYRDDKPAAEADTIDAVRAFAPQP
jgi:DNA ligase-1